MISIFLSGCMLTGKLPSTLAYSRSDHTTTECKSKDPEDINNYRPIAIATALSKALEQVLLLRLARYLWTADIFYPCGFGVTIQPTFALVRVVRGD